MSATTATKTASKLSTKLAYGFGSVAFGIKDGGFGRLLVLYYNQVLGLNAIWVGASLAVAMVLDAFIDPVIGYLSDNWRSRLGRRHPFMYAAALPAAVSYLFIWNPPAGLSQGQLFAYLTGMAIVVRTFVSLYEVPSTALVAELTSDYDQRTSFLGFRYLFGWWGSMLLNILTFKVLMTTDATHKFAQLNPTGYVHYSIIAAVMMFVAIIVSARGTQRQVRVDPNPAPARPFVLARALSEARETLSNRGVLPLLGAGFFATMALGVGGALMSYVETFFWQLKASQTGTLMIASMIGSVSAFALATRVGHRFGKRRAAVGMSILAFFITPAPVILRMVGLAPATASDGLIAFLFVAGALASTCAITGNILWSSMNADLVEDSELKTGRRSEGLLFAINAFVLKCTSGMGVLVGGLILNLVGFPNNAVPGKVPQAVLNRLLILDMGSVSLLYLLAMLCLAAYPITKAMHQANLDKLGRSAGEPPPDVLRPGAGNSGRGAAA